MCSVITKVKYMKLLTIFLVSLSSTAFSNDRVFNRIYEDVQGDLACIKRLNGTHEIGCTSSFRGNVGIIHVIHTNNDWLWLTQHNDYAPYVLAIKTDFLTTKFLTEAASSGIVSGIVVMASENYERPVSFSGEQSCPNNQNSLYLNTSYNDYCKKHPWNPFGSSLLFMNWDFPIFLMTDDRSISQILDCFNTFNNPLVDSELTKTWPFCAIQLSSNMHASVSTKVCLRRSEVVFASDMLCEPLEDINIWGSTQPFNQSVSVKNDSIIFLSTTADAYSLFNDISPGADAAISGLVTVLLTAEALFHHEKELSSSASKNIFFSIFEGEAWNYIGSSRMVYDMVNNKFPYEKADNHSYQMSQINLDNIHSILDLRQVGFMRNRNDDKFLYLHSDPISNSDESLARKTQDVVSELVDNSKDFNLNFAVPQGIPLPPSSIQSFNKVRNISGVLISDHANEFKNKYYMSFYDDAKNLNYTFDPANNETISSKLHEDIADLASVVASSLFKLATGTKKRVTANKTISHELLYCFLNNMNCSFFQENSDAHLKKFLENGPAKTFISVKRSNSPLTVLTLRILSRFIGKKVNMNETSCKSNNSLAYNLVYFPYVDNGTCFKTSVHHSEALSPAFIIKDYDWSSDRYSTWTESMWSENKARIFLVPSRNEEILLIVMGAVSIILSFIIVHLVSSRAKMIFVPVIQPASC